jgi:probable phosphoglycerate mutase
VNELWLVRHGSTEWTVSRQHTGRTDIPLNAGGEQRARSLEPVLATHSFAAVFTSPLQRARRTAALAGFEDAVVDEQLVEVDYGDYEGRTTAEIHQSRPDWLLWRYGSPGGESIDDAGRRADEGLARLEAIDGNVLVFGHGHFSRVLGARLLGLPASAGAVLSLGPASVSVIGSEHEIRAIKHWNWQAKI